MAPARIEMVDPAYSDSDSSSISTMPQGRRASWKGANGASTSKAKSSRRSWQPVLPEEVNNSTSADEGEDGDEQFSLTVANTREKRRATHNLWGKVLPMSDPKSEIWKGRESAKLAVVIPIRGTKRAKHLLTDEDSDVVPGKPKDRLWLHSIPISAASSATLKQASISSFLRPTVKLRLSPSETNTLPSSPNGGGCDDDASSGANEFHHKKVITPGSRKQASASLRKSLQRMKTPRRTSYSPGILSSSRRSSPSTVASSSRSTRDKISGSQLRSRAAKNVSRRVSTLSLMGDELSADELENNRFTSDDEDGDYKEDSGDGDFNLDESEDTQEDDIEDDIEDELEDDESQEDETEQSDDEVDYPKPKRLKNSKSFEVSGNESKNDHFARRDTLSSPYPVNGKDTKKALKAIPKVEKPRLYYKYKIGTQEHLKPIHKIPDIFADMAENAMKVGLADFLKHLNGRKLKVATMCSGTESPILALNLFSEALKKSGWKFEIDHLFSAEIVPFKQAYIERNFSPPILFRDVKELARKGAFEATTAYGGKAEIPGGVDLLVTGFSCVDFSALNNKKKRLEAEGESGDTFFSLRKYALRFRPKMIVVENVSTAPWDKIQTEFRKIGYHSHFKRLDTKNFYVPHTRVRGYLICIDRHLYGLTRDSKSARGQKNLDSATAKMKEVLEALGRPASSTVEAFSLAEDDPRVQVGREELSASGRGDSARQTVDWTRCHTRHEVERTNQCLGQMRPITRWQDGGSCKPADYMWRDWTQVQVERVLDTIDMSFLRNLNRGFDQQYKVRVLDLSQNVDRNIDTTGAGITGCLTPSGIPWNTMRGGPLVGVESLALQGLPIDRLQLSHEKQSQLQDLAGNAMSSPVVGAAILAILIAGHTVLPPGQADEGDSGKSDLSVPSMDEQYLIPVNANLTSYEPVSVAQLIDLASKSSRLCLCEGRSFLTKSRLQKCSSCKHTTCEKCGGNPSHEKYEPINTDIISQRILPSDFEDIVKRAIPMKVEISGITDDYFNKVLQQNSSNICLKDWKASISAVQMAFQSELRFNSARRSETWTIFYESDHARMELLIEPDKVQWLLFGKPPPAEPVNSRIRKLLSSPIARMNPDTNDITKGSWQLWLPQVHEIEASITGHGDMNRSFENVMGLGRSYDMFVWKNYTISIPEPDAECLDVDISGTYHLLQNCGTASGSLHVKTDTEASSAPLFLFLDPDRIHNPENDYFVFSTDKRRLKFDEKRSIIARVDPKWRPKQFKPEEEAKKKEVKENDNIVKIFVDGSWIDLPNVHFKKAAIKQDELFNHARPDLGILDNPDLPQHNKCQSHIAIFSCHAAYPKGEGSQYMENSWRRIDIIEQKEFFTEFAWLMQRAKVVSGLDRWREISDYAHDKCSSCAPTPPGIKWKIVTEQKKGKLTTGLTAFENPREAADFEAILKTRVSPLVTQFYMDSDGFIQLKIGFSPLSLIHRAAAKLSSSPDIKLEVSWRLVTNDITYAKPSLPKFEKIRANDDDVPAANPPGFKLNLRPEQLRSLGWMLKQEEKDAEPFIEEEVEECLISHLGWRAEGRARKPIKVQGGLLADDVGFGKTATILGLIDTKRPNDKIMSKLPVNGHIRVKATLIMVPHHLCDQWRREIEKFMAPSQKYHVLVIRNLAVLKSYTIEQFQLADIIIASLRFCDDEEYLNKIAEFAGVVELPKTRPWRATCTWYQDALKHMPRLVDELKDGGAKVAAMVKENLSISEERAKSEEFYVPSKRLRGQAYQDAKDKRVRLVKSRESPEPSASKRKRSPSVKKDPQDTESEDDTDSEDPDLQPAVVKKAKGKMTGSKRKRDLEDTESEDDTDPESIVAQKGKGKKSKVPAMDFIRRTDPFGITQISKGQKKWSSMKCPLFELFEFSRLVVDEYTYVTGQESLTVSNIKAKSRWILSATPSLKDFADVKSIASFLGINLGIDDFANGAIQPSTAKRMMKDRTDAEEFRSFKETHSAAWHKNRNSIAQRFLHQFVRKNVPKIGDIKFTEHIMPITLPPAEQAIYLELQQLLASSDFKMKKRKANNNNDKERRIRELLGTSESPGEALIKCASHFTLDGMKVTVASADDACNALVNLREKQLGAIKADLQRKTEQADWLYRNCGNATDHYQVWEKKISEDGFGDPTSLVHMKEVLTAVARRYLDEGWRRFYKSGEEPDRATKSKQKRVKSRKNKSEEDDTDDDEPSILPLLPPECDFEKGVFPRQIELRNVVNDLYKKCDELIARCRSLRYLDTIRGLQRSFGNNCSCANCGKRSTLPEKFFILQLCGHILCNTCLAPYAGKHLQCLVKSCNAYHRPHEVLRAKELCVDVESTRIGRRYGQKIGQVIQLVESIPEDEQVLLFVQFEDLMTKFIEAFDESGIGYSQLTGHGNTSKILEDFQTNSGKSKKKVLVLNMGDETAAGSNLTNANHVIFTSPYLAWSQHDYEQSVVQAKGRSIRYGQTKHVHIYHFLSLRTVDVDITQARTGKILINQVQDAPEPPFKKVTFSHFGFRDSTGETDVGEFSSPIFGKMDVDLDIAL